MVKKYINAALFLSLSSSLLVSSLNAEDGLELNVLATTQELYAVGLSYGVNDYVKVGAGALAINGLESSLTTVNDEFLGAYAIVELKYPVMDKVELFIDGSYISGELDISNKSVNEAIGAGGLKYNLDNTYSFFTGYTTEQTGFVGVDYSITPKWTLTLGGSYNNDYNEGQAIIGISYNFGSGMNSALTTSAKYVAQDEYSKSITPAPVVAVVVAH